MADEPFFPFDDLLPLMRQRFGRGGDGGWMLAKEGEKPDEAVAGMVSLLLTATCELFADFPLGFG